jgi:ABC-type antimicrobial peptide transport system permease subunit
MRLTLVGIALGVAFALGTTRLLGTLLFGVGPRDPIVFSGVAAIMAATSIAACLVPAWKASRVDPVTALKS